MKLPLSKEMKDMLRRTALMTAALVFAAHAFCFFNLTYSGASVMLGSMTPPASLYSPFLKSSVR